MRIKQVPRTKGESVVRASRMLSLLGLLLVVALLAPLGAAAKPPERQAPLAPLPSLLTPRPQIAGAHLVVTRLTSAPVGARAGHAYLLRGSIVNLGGAAVRSRVVVHLVRVGSHPSAIGGTVVCSRRTVPAPTASASGCRACLPTARTRSSRARSFAA